MNRHHHEGKLLAPITASRAMTKQSALESLSSLSYTKEFATYLVDTARIVIHRSIEDPFKYAQPKTDYFVQAGSRHRVTSFGLGLKPGAMVRTLEERCQGLSSRQGGLINHPNFLLLDPQASALEAWINSGTSLEANDKYIALGSWLSQIELPDNASYTESILSHVAVCGSSVGLGSSTSEVISFDSERQEVLRRLFCIFRTHNKLPLLKEALRKRGTSKEDLEEVFHSVQKPRHFALTYWNRRGGRYMKVFFT